MSRARIMAPTALTVGLLVAALMIYLYAGDMPADDARGGPYVTMGGERD